MEKRDSDDADATQIFSVFPLEIWEKTVENLEDADEYSNFTKSFPLLKGLVEPLRQIYLFPQVLRILERDKWLCIQDSTDILKCRLVCSRWKRAVDSLLEIRPYHSSCIPSDKCYLPRPFPILAESDIARPSYFRLFSYTIEKLEFQVIPQISSFSYHGKRSPFPSRHLELSDRNFWSQAKKQNLTLDQAAHAYWMATEKILEKVGHHFWHAVIDIGNFSSVVEWNERVKNCVKFMPNLKSLYIVCGNGIHSEDLTLPENFLPFPKLENLNLLSLQYVPECVAKEILMSNDPKIVEISRRLGSSSFPFKYLKDPEQLSVVFFRAEEFLQMRDDWKPKVLWLTVLNADTLRVEDILGKLESYKGSLEKLMLVLPDCRVEAEGDKLWESALEYLH